MSSQLNDYFAQKNVAATYSGAERLTGEPGRALLVQAGLVPSPAAFPETGIPSDMMSAKLILDNACGTAIISSLFFDLNKGSSSETKVVCGDISAAMVESVQKRIEQGKWNAEAKVLDAQALALPDDHFTHVLNNSGLQSMPDGPLAVKESVRVTRPGGLIGFTNWTAVGWLPPFLSALSRVPNGPSPSSVPFVERFRADKTWTPDSTRSMLSALPTIDASSIKIEEFEFKTSMRTDDEVKEFMRLTQSMIEGPILGGCTEDERKVIKEANFMGLLEEEIKALKELTWIALIVTARKSE